MPDRKTQPQTVSVVSSAAGVAVIGGNPHRVAFLFATPVGRSTFVALGAAGAAARGLIVVAASQPLALTADQLGTSIQEAITLTDTAGAQQTFDYIEILSAV